MQLQIPAPESVSIHLADDGAHSKTARASYLLAIDREALSKSAMGKWVAYGENGFIAHGEDYIEVANIVKMKGEKLEDVVINQILPWTSKAVEIGGGSLTIE